MIDAATTMRSTAAEAAARLVRLAGTLRMGMEPEPADVAAFAQAIATWQTERCTLDEAFGLKLEKGQLHPATRTAIDERNVYLRRAADMLTVPPAQRASELARALNSYAGNGWIRDEKHDECPRRLVGTVREMFWRALKAWPQTVSERQLRRIARQTYAQRARRRT